jgi:hypothetical protein
MFTPETAVVAAVESVIVTPLKEYSGRIHPAGAVKPLMTGAWRSILTVPVTELSFPAQSRALKDLVKTPSFGKKMEVPAVFASVAQLSPPSALD